MKRRFLIIALGCQLIFNLSLGGEAVLLKKEVAKEQLSKLLYHLKEKKEPNKQTMIQKLETYIDRLNSSETDITLNLILAFSYLNAENEANLRQAQYLFSNIISIYPDSWHSDLARFGLVGAVNMFGNHEQTILTSKESLQKLNFDRLSADKDNQDLVRFKSVFEINTDEIRDGIKMILANAYLKNNQLMDSEKVLKTINNQNFSNLVSKEIELYRNSK